MNGADVSEARGTVDVDLGNKSLGEKGAVEAAMAMVQWNAATITKLLMGCVAIDFDQAMQRDKRPTDNILTLSQPHLFCR